MRFTEFTDAAEANPLAAEKLSRALARLAHTKYYSFLTTEYWQMIRLAVRARDKAKCVDCGAFEDELNVHHLTYERVGFEWRNLSDLVTLCRGCHEDRHGLGVTAVGELLVELLADAEKGVRDVG